MFLKTFKGRILAVSLGMTIVSVSIFGYGLAGIYYQHMHKCLYRSLTLCDYYGWELRCIQTEKEYKVELRLI